MTTTINVRDYLDPSWLQAYKDWLPEARLEWSRLTVKSGYGVEQSTARSYSTGARGQQGPVALFDAWAAVQVDALAQDPSWRETMADATSFENAHQAFAQSLQDYWCKSVAGVQRESARAGAGAGKRVVHQLSVGQKYKLLDLFVRYLWIEHRDAAKSADENLPHAHTPLDRKSLHVLSACYRGILMAPSFSMGNIVAEEQYRYCQDLVRIVCEEAGGTPLLFDVFAWNHGRAKALYGPAAKYSGKATTQKRTGRQDESRTAG